VTERLSGTAGHELAQRTRIAGMDLASGLALLGMMAAHVFDADDPSTVTTVAADWSVTTFALVAGVSLALISGGKRARRERAAVRAGIAVHAVLVAVIGLAFGFTGRADIVLPCFAVLFLLAIPLLGLRRWMLTRIAAVLLLVAPPMITATVAGAVPRPVDNPTFATLITSMTYTLSVRRSRSSGLRCSWCTSRWWHACCGRSGQREPCR
jgi:uncharacterized membrane protein